ncbi:UNVERIFIED_CONTAM: protein PHOTOPERIOD-INDEPENDENT EARLY FLOWERING 1, partial [Sesamum latifolium]
RGAEIKKIGSQYFQGCEEILDKSWYSSMLAENLVNSPNLCESSNLCTIQEQPTVHQKGGGYSDKQAFVSDTGPQSKVVVQDKDYDLQPGDKSALNASKEPRRPKTHWDHVLEEMVWLSKDFDSRGKWKLAQSKGAVFVSYLF